MFYITYCNLDLLGWSGVKKKVISQTSVFKKSFRKAYYTCYAGHMAYLFDGEHVVEKEVAVTRREYNQVLCGWLEKYNIMRTYIRYPLADKWFLHLLEFQKQKDIKFVLEIPSYPYDKEWELNYSRQAIEDAYFREFLKEYTDLVATYAYHDKLWGIRCITLYNGVDIGANKLSKKEKKEKELVLIAISSMAFWNGYERLITGMKDYYLSKNLVEVKLKLVGSGPEEGFYRRLTVTYGLQKYIEFCGNLVGKELDDVYDQSDVAVSSLGAYKKNIYDSCPMKGAEYCARGLPMICGYNDMRFPDKIPFVLKVSNDEKPINIYNIIHFYEKISAFENYRELIRKYAKEHLTWEGIMQPVIEYLL
ncbi:MAG: glycosyltransferase family 4 protein [Lachnospiraceae bacterium]|jgi:glycosyltransferase involved in cell wall biosynthesis|nr:glycosyltransferase family 4 protein [Lachnospiraceae bacterium]